MGMSDEEYYEEEEVTSKGDGNFLKARQEAKKGELDEQLKEYINEWRKQRAKEEEELKRKKDRPRGRKSVLSRRRNWPCRSVKKRSVHARKRLRRRPRRLRKKRKRKKRN